MYIIAGVTGRTGAVVADLLLRAGKPVRVVVREGARAAPWQARGAEAAVASLDDATALTRALQDAEGAYLLSPQNFTSADPIGDGWRIADAIARAVDASGLRHLVMLSALAAQREEGGGLPRTLRAAEQRLAGATAATTFVRAAYFLENWAPVLGGAAGAGKLPTFIHPERTLPMVSVRDVALAAVRALLEGPPPGGRRIIELAGPRDYCPRDLAAAVATLVGRPVEPAHAPLEAVIPALTGMGASPAFAGELRAMYQAIAEDLQWPGPGAGIVRGSVDAVAAFAAILGGGDGARGAT